MFSVLAAFALPFDPHEFSLAGHNISPPSDCTWVIWVLFIHMDLVRLRAVSDEHIVAHARLAESFAPPAVAHRVGAQPAPAVRLKPLATRLLDVGFAELRDCESPRVSSRYLHERLL